MAPICFAVNLDDKAYEKSAKVGISIEDVNGQLNRKGRISSNGSKADAVQRDKTYDESDSLRLKKGNMEQRTGSSASKKDSNLYQDSSGSDSENRHQKNVSYSSKSDVSKKVTVTGADSLQGTSEVVEAAGDSSVSTQVGYMILHIVATQNSFLFSNFYFCAIFVSYFLWIL